MGETTTARSALEAFDDSSPSGGAPMQLSNDTVRTGEAQNAADALRAMDALSTQPPPPPRQSPLHTSYGPGWETLPADQPAPEPLKRIGQAVVEGYKNTPPLLTPEARDAVDKSGFLGQQIYNPILDAAGGALGGVVGAGAGLGQGVYELGNAVSPRLGRDLHGLYEAAMTLLPQAAGPRAGLKPPEAPPVMQGGPRSVMERMAPPPIEGQTTLGRAIDLLRHDQLWNDPNTPGYHPPGFDPNQAFTPPGAVPPPSGPPMSGVPDTLLTRALGPDPAVAPPPVARPPIGTPTTSAEAKTIASAYYDIANNRGGTLTPQFTNKFIDSVSGIGKQTEAGQTVAGQSTVSGLVDRLQGLRDKPMTLQGAQEVDEGLGDLIDKEYGPTGISKEGVRLAQLQRDFRDQIQNAEPGDITGGSDGFDALAPARKAWSQAMKMSDLERIQYRANMMEQPSTATRTQLRTLLSNATKSRGYSDEEIAALENSAKLGVVGGALRAAGSRLVPLVTAAGAGGGPVGQFMAFGAGHGFSNLMRGGANRIAANRLADAMRVLGQSVPPDPAGLPPF